MSRYCSLFSPLIIKYKIHLLAVLTFFFTLNKLYGDKIEELPFVVTKEKINMTLDIDLAEICESNIISDNIAEIKRRGGIRKTSKCPSEPYVLDYFSVFTSEEKRIDTFTFIEIGCNKATDSVQMLRLFTQNPRADLRVHIQKSNFNIKSATSLSDQYEVHIGSNKHGGRDGSN